MGKDLVRGGEHVLLAARAVPKAAAHVQPQSAVGKPCAAGSSAASVALRNARRRRALPIPGTDASRAR